MQRRIRNTLCAICGHGSHSVPVVEANFDPGSITLETFSARRMPDRRTFPWVRCLECGLLRADPVEVLDLDFLYQESVFTYEDEVKNLQRTYRNVVSKGVSGRVESMRILEVGGGNGFFLEEALRMGFADVAGLEPSKKAIEQASPGVRNKIQLGMIADGRFPPESFDVIALFHVLDHLPEPLESLKTLLGLLKPGGQIIVAVHNSKSVSSRVLRARSPIFDVEHFYLFDLLTGPKVLELSGFTQVRGKPYWNWYSLHYLVRLLPIPRALKQRMLASGFGQRLKKLSVKVPLGNMWLGGLKNPIRLDKDSHAN